MAVSPAAAVTACFDLVQTIVPLAHGSWRYPMSGEAGLVVHTIPVADPWHGLLDIIAWEPTQPLAWWRWTRQAAVLADPSWLGSRGPPGPIRLVESPAHWLRDRCEAVCVLDWSIDLSDWFWGLRLVPESPRLKLRLAKALAAGPAVVVI